MEKLVLIDGSSLIHRAFYALPLLNNAAGEYTNGVYGFMNMLNKVIEQQKPAYLAVCFDKSRITFRNAIREDYKGTRKETPMELSGQMELIKEVLSAADISWLELDNYEADDLLGTLALEGEKAGMQVAIYSGDKDILQLITENTQVYLTKRGISVLEEWDIPRVQEEYGLKPLELRDLKGLMGDSSDNICGVPGVGIKTALKLLAQFHNIENLYANLDEVANAKLREKLAQNQENAEVSKKLATICLDVPLKEKPGDFAYQEPSREKLEPVYRRLGFKSLLDALPQPQPQANAEELPWGTEEAAFEYQLLSAADLPALSREIYAAGAFSFAFRWQGPAIDRTISAFALALPGGQAYGAQEGDISDFIRALAPLLEDEKLPKITAHSKEAAVLLGSLGISLKNITEDIILAAYLLEPEASDYLPEDLAFKEGIVLPPSDEAGALPREAALYFLLAPKLQERLKEKEMEKLYREIELPLAQVLAGMEAAGVRVDGAELGRLGAEMEEATERLAGEIHALAGMEFNVNSPKQLGELLFDKLGIPPVKKTKTGYSTDSEVLEQLAGSYPIAGKVLDYRTHAKLKSTYAEGLAALINPKSGKIHTSYKQTVTATGRLSSVEPNLQNIPIRLELGRRIRRAFKPSQEGNFLLGGDYNQIELRILAHISGDEGLQEAFARGEDIHAATASQVFGVEMAAVTPDLRRKAKAVNFGIVYGISDYGLGRDLGISRREAKEYIERYFFRYPKVAAYQREVVLQGKEEGYVSTLMGRRRYLPGLRDRNFNSRSLAQRMAINTPIQGSAADIIKVAMVRIDEEIKRLGLASRMILQVHDELIFDLVPEEKEALIALAEKEMTQAFPLAIPLTVDMKLGQDWYAMEKL